MRVRLLLSGAFLLGKQDKLVEAADAAIEAFKLIFDTLRHKAPSKLLIPLAANRSDEES